MGIRRDALSFEGQFTQIPNAWLRDKRISRRARGLLGELMSHRVGWEINFASLEEAGPEGREALQSAIRELKALGYLRIVQDRRDDGSHRFAEVHYVVSEPTDEPSEPVYGFSGERVSRSTGSPLSGKSATKKNISKEDDVKKTKTRGTRVPEVFAISDEMRAWAAVEVPSVGVDAETVKFVDYWKGVPGQRGVKLDWPATWRNAMRRAHEFNVKGGWKPEARVANADAERIAREKAAWCASVGITVAEYDAHANDREWLENVMRRAS